MFDLKESMKKSVLYTLVAMAFCTQAMTAFADDDTVLADARGVKPAGQKAASKAAAPVSVPKAVAQPAKGTAATGVAAEVNGEKIMKADLERMLDAIREQEPSLSADLPEAKAALDNIRQQVLSNLIEHRLLVQEAARRNIVPPTAEVDKGVKALRGEGLTDEAYKAVLAKEGKTPADVRQFVTEELAVRLLTDKITSDITFASIPAAEVTKFYNANTEQWIVAPTAKAHHILVAVKEGASAADKTKARNKALNLLKQSQVKGADFVALATQFSDEPAAKQTGGDLGEFERDQMVKSFSDAVWAAKIGSVIGPIQTDYGFHIIRIDARTPGGKIPIEKVTNDIKVFLVRQKMKDKLDQQVKALQAAATIKKFS